MATYNRFDAHCHIFTLEYALKEVKNMWRDMKHGTYPWEKPEAASTDKLMAAKSGKRKKISDIIELLKQLYELIHAAGGSEEENLDFLQKEGKKAFPDSDLQIVPLMMDIFYMLAYPLDKGEDISEAKRDGMLEAAAPSDEEVEDSWHEILDGFKTYVEDKKNDKKFAAKLEIAELALQLIEKERSAGKLLKSGTVAADGGYSSNFGFYQTDGFCFHMDNLMDLVKNRKGELYPFVAIDPRRPGMIDALLSGRFFTGDSKFYGVKLYPRMGVHPLSTPMADVYKYCSDNKLPITFHCGKGGFPPSTEWKYSDYGNPANFEPVIQDYPDLKIDFAHMGSSDPSYEWADKIVDMVNNYDNVYSDLSCYTNTGELEPMKKYWDENPKLKERLMFGTDFDVMYLTDKVTMQIYYNNFKSIFSEDEMKVLMHDNPLKFLEDVLK